MEVTLPAVRTALAARQPRRLAEDATHRAAVATVLREGAREPEVLLIERAQHPDDPWSGHMAFPGGRQDAIDANLLRTAERETHEEVGLDLRRHGTLIGQLDDVEAIARGRVTGLVIRPYVYEVESTPPLIPNYEVADILWAPLGPLATGQADTVRPYEHEGRRYSLPAFDVEGRIVWGLTYQMLRSFLAALDTGARGPNTGR
jgi:8-oxo-dGTP pyrophosphatase MutT (NUDIX family)